MTDLRLVIFDCDGTLVDSQAPITASMKTAFKAVGVAYPGDEAVKGVVGLSLHDAAALLLPEGEQGLALRLEAEYKKAFVALREADKVYEPLYPKVLATLKGLKSENVFLGVATGKGHRGLMKTLALHGILDLFDTLQTADHHPGKPNPSMLHKALQDTGVGAERALFVGDTTFDMEMGRNAGIFTLGVSWGYHDKAHLLAAGAGEIIERMDEVVHHALRL